MTDRQWTRDELVNLVSDGLVSARDHAGADVDPPDWLVTRAVGLLPFDASESLDVLHPDDRGTMIAHFLEAVKAPGEVVTTHFRALYDGTWRHIESMALNLLHDSDIGSILYVNREVDGEDIIEGNQQVEGDQAATNWMLLTLDESGVVTSVEGNATAMLGYEVAEIVGRLPTDFIPSESLAEVVRMWLELNEQPDVTRVSRHRWNRKDGRGIWIESSFVHRTASESDRRFLVVMWDITERRAAEKELRKMAADFRLLADEVPAAVFRCDRTGAVSFHNSGWDDMFSGRVHIDRLHDLLVPEEQSVLDEVLTGGHAGAPTARAEVEVVGRDGTVWRLTLRPLATSGVEDPDFIGSLQDITPTVKLRRKATYDSVTGLFNRAAMEQVIEAELAAAEPAAVVMFVDLDHFKAVNDDLVRRHPADS